MPALQRVPHAPQLSGSVSMFLHCPLQLIDGGVQVITTAAHAPAEHVMPEGHTVPQAPQLLGSRCVSTHDAPQRVRPTSH